MKLPKSSRIHIFSSSHGTFTELGHKLLEPEKGRSIGSAVQNSVHLFFLNWIRLLVTRYHMSLVLDLLMGNL